MTITLNGKSVEITPQKTLLLLLSEHGFVNKMGIAVAINNSVVPKANWEAQVLNNGDKILVISATKGG